MRIALEGFILLNLLMNGFTLLMSARIASCKRIRPGRILCGAWAGMAYALLAYTWPPAKTVLFFPVSLLMAASIGTADALARALAVRGHLDWLHVFAGRNRVCAHAGIKKSRPRACFGYTHRSILRPSSGAHAYRTIWIDNSTAALRISGNSAEIEGFVDSGNRLIDAVTGLPVIVVSAADVRGMLPESADPTDISTLPPGFRLLALAGVCGTEMAMCFHPRVWVRQRDAWCEVQAVMAVAPRPLPEGALVPFSLV